MTNLTISVIIPTHNRPKDLRRAILSVFRQTQLPKELIVIDDGSTPPVAEDIFRDAPQNLTTSLLRNDTCRGASKARNQGIKNAASEWIAFLDDDDEFLPGKIRAVSKALGEHSNCDLLYHSAKINMVNEGVAYITKPRQYEPGENVFRSLLVKNEIGGTPMVIARRSKLLEAGGFDENIPALEDYELWLRLTRMGSVIQRINQPLTQCNYITRKKSISKNVESNNIALQLIEQKYANEYASLSVSEKKQHEVWKRSMVVHKALLSGNIPLAFKEQIKQLTIIPHPKYFIEALAILAGPKVVFWLRARFR